MAIVSTAFVVGVVRDDTLAPTLFYVDTTALTLARGSAVKVRLKIYKSDGTAQNLSEVGLAVSLGIKPRLPRGAAAVYTLECDIVDAAEGIVETTITSAISLALTPDAYLWDALLVDGDGVPTQVVLLSEFTVVGSAALPGAAVVPPAETPLGTAVRRITYVVTAADVLAGGQDLSVPISPAESSASYGALANVSKTAVGVVPASCPNGVGDRTTAIVRVLVGAALAAGDEVEVYLTR